MLGDYLYIDGGYVSQVASGNDSLAVNTTLALSLTTSWTNETAAFDAIDKASAGAPDLSMPVFWKDDAAGVLYSWAGMTIRSDQVDDDINLWRLDPDGAGGGTVRTPRPFLRFLFCAVDGEMLFETSWRVTTLWVHNGLLHSVTYPHPDAFLHVLYNHYHADY